MRAGNTLVACALILIAADPAAAVALPAPVVEVVRVRDHPDAAEKSWRRVAIGGLEGEDGYVARAIGHGAGGDDDAPTELWTFTDAELGPVYGSARIARTNVKDARGDVEWAAVFGGGREDPPGAANLFVLFIDRGVDGWAYGDFVKIPADTGEQRDNGERPTLPNVLGEPALVDTDLDGSADLAYAGDLQGNLYRFDIADSDPSTWRAVRLFRATHGNPSATSQPITQRPFVAKHPRKGGFVVVFGTGSGRTVQGVARSDIQSVYGIWDRGEIHPATARSGARSDRLVRRELVNVVDETAGTFQTRRVLSGNAVDPVADAPGRTGTYGWYIDLDMPRAGQTLQGNPNPDACGQPPPDPQYPGERVAGSPVVRGSVLLMATVIPGEATRCSDAPSGSVLAVEPATGGSPRAGVFDLDGDGRIETGIAVPDLFDAPVAGVVFDGDTPTGAPGKLAPISARDGSATLVVGDGEGAPSLGIGGAASIRTGRLSWREIPGETP